MKSAEKIIEEMRRLNHEYGFNSFKLTHDNFTTNRNDVIDFCQAASEAGISDLRWGCSSRIDTVDKELLQIMKDSGCEGIFFGIESGTARMQKIIKKDIPVRAIDPIINSALELDIHCGVSTIVGFPEEDWDDVSATIDIFLRFAGIKKALPQMHILSPQPGTEILEHYSGKLEYDGWFPDRAHFNNWTPKSEHNLVKAHPNLFSSFYYLPNNQVKRDDLLQIVEFLSLLIGYFPGITAFIRRTQPAILDLINCWRQRCKENDLPIPDGSGFFTMTAMDLTPYLKLLLHTINEMSSLNERELDFIKYWSSLVKTQSGEGIVNIPTARGYQNFSIDQQSIVLLDAKPILAKSCLIQTLDYDVRKTIHHWRNYGKWRWPEKKSATYLIVKQQFGLHVVRIEHITSVIIQSCDGNHSIAEMITLVDKLEDLQSVLYRKELGTSQLVARVLSNLSKDVGFRVKRELQ